MSATVPVDQQAAMADDEVSAAEYQAAFGKFEDCVAAGGGTIVGVKRDPASGLITFGIDAASGRLGSPGRPGTGLAGRCYESEFAYIDQAFSTGPAAQAAESEEELQLFRQEQAPCLELNGVVIPVDLEVGSDEWNALYQQFLDLASKGKCPGITVSR